MDRCVRILGTGHAVPAMELASSEIDRRLGLAPGRIEALSGVRRRFVAARDETAAQLAARAARAALDSAGLAVADIDCIVAASATMDQGMPSNAALIHAELGLGSSGVPAFDVNASCLGFIAALDQLSWPLDARRYRHLLVVAADFASCGLNWSELEASAIFGDGAAAAVLGNGGDSTACIRASLLRTFSDGAHYCEIPGGGSRYHPERTEQAFLPLTRFRMDGKKVFRLASQHLPVFLDDLLAQARLGLDAIDWIVPHQASRLALQHLIKRLAIPERRVIDIFADHGNQVAASLPTALDIGIRDGRIRRGQTLLLLGTGAGLSLGGAILDY